MERAQQRARPPTRSCRCRHRARPPLAGHPRTACASPATRSATPGGEEREPLVGTVDRSLDARGAGEVVEFLATLAIGDARQAPRGPPIPGRHRGRARRRRASPRGRPSAAFVPVGDRAERRRGLEQIVGSVRVREPERRAVHDAAVAGAHLGPAAVEDRLARRPACPADVRAARRRSGCRRRAARLANHSRCRRRTSPVSSVPPVAIRLVHRLRAIAVSSVQEPGGRLHPRQLERRDRRRGRRAPGGTRTARPARRPARAPGCRRRPVASPRSSREPTPGPVGVPAGQLVSSVGIKGTRSRRRLPHPATLHGQGSSSPTALTSGNTRRTGGTEGSTHMDKIGPKHRTCRRVGAPLCGRPNCPSNKRPYPPGQHGRGRKRISEYQTRLVEKQKLRAIYGVSESQMRRYYDEATRSKGVTGEELIGRLETRLDTVVLRLGFALTTRQARQLVSHGHVAARRQAAQHAEREGEARPDDRDRRQGEELRRGARGPRRSRADPPPYLYRNKEEVSGTLSRGARAHRGAVAGRGRRAPDRRVLLVTDRRRPSARARGAAGAPSPILPQTTEGGNGCSWGWSDWDGWAPTCPAA